MGRRCGPRSARAACARTPPPRKPLTTPLYLAAACLAFLVAAAGQYWLYSRLLRPALALEDPLALRRRLLRWVAASGGWQGLTVLAAVVYVLLMRRAGVQGLAWLAPALGLLAGSLLPLQLAAGRIGRAGIARL